MANLVLVHRGADEIKRQVAQDFGAIIRELATEKIITAATAFALELFKKRTKKGRAVDGSEFADYSEMWAKVREEAGLQTDHVDLTFSGEMMAGFVAEILSPTTAELSVTGPHEDVAEAHQHGDGRLPVREFFGFGDAEMELMERFVKRELVKLMLEAAPNTVRGDLTDEQILGDEIRLENVA